MTALVSPRVGSSRSSSCWSSSSWKWTNTCCKTRDTLSTIRTLSFTWRLRAPPRARAPACRDSDGPRIEHATLRSHCRHTGMWLRPSWRTASTSASYL